MNKVILMGRLTRDPEVRHTPSGSMVANFGLAVDKYSKENGRQADFFDIVCWEKRAEFASKWLKKGNKIALSGRLQQRKWKDKEGNDRTSYEIVADELEFADSKASGESGGGQGQYAPGQYASGQYAAPEYSSPSQGYAAPSAAQSSPSSFQELTDDEGELPF